MNSPRNRFKVFDIEFVRIKITVPTNDIKRMRGINEIRDLIFLFDFDEKIAFLIFRFYESWRNNITLTKWRMFQQLPKLISVTFGRVNRGMRFYEKENIVFRFQFQLINCSSRNDEIVADREVNVSEHCFENSPSGVYEK